jgi:rod shape-determining protein MreC
LARVVETRRSRLLLAALVVSHLVVISRQVDVGGGTSLLEQVVFGLLSPVQASVSRLVAGVGSAWSAYVALRGVRAENQEMAARIRTLELQLEGARQQALEAERLRNLLALRAVVPLRTLAAEVVAREGLPWFRSVTLDKGERDGVALDAPVISASGVVGRVMSVGPRAARVQLLLDRDAGVGVLIERSRATGVASGQVGLEEAGHPELLMKYVSVLADVEVGDRVLTSGLDRIYPKGLVVGRVRSVGTATGLFKEVFVTPTARFDQLEEVLVVTSLPGHLTLTESVR